MEKEYSSNKAATSNIAIAPRPMPATSSSVENSETRARPENLKRKRIACQECRQGKLRCEASSRDACARCLTLGIPCVYDNEYKRYDKRRKLRELAEEVERLRATKAANQITPLPQDNSPSQENEGFEPSTGVSSSRVDPTSPAVLAGQPSHNKAPDPYAHCKAFQPQSLGNTSVSAAQITRLFRRFFSEYHSHMPIVESHASPDDCYSQSPLLFWTIIVIASRHDEDEPTMLGSLAASIKSLLWQTVGCPPHTRPDLKAMILICLYPFPTSSMSTDPSYILASACKSSGMHVGIHRPYFAQDFSRVKFTFRPEEVQDALIIWVACFIAAESITSFTGQQPLFVTDATLEALCNSDNTPQISIDLYHSVLIWRFCNRFHRVMASRERRIGSLGENDSGVLLPLYESELEQLRQQLGDELSKDNEIIFLHASLQLRCYYFLERHAKSSLKEGLLKAYHSALSIVWRIQARETEAQLLKRGPILFQNALSIASVFLLKILRSSYSQLLDVEEGRKAFNLSLRLLRKCSIEDNDLPGRFSKILAQLWCATPEESSPHKGLSVTTRLAGSLLHDTLWRWREKFGGHSCVTQASSGSHAAASSTVDVVSSTSSLPLASGERYRNDHVVDPAAAAPQTFRDHGSAPALAVFDNGGTELPDESNMDWLWSGGGLSSLMAIDVDAMDFPGEFDGTFAGDTHSANPH